MQKVTQSKVITDEKDQGQIWKGGGGGVAKSQVVRGGWVKAKIVCRGRISRRSHNPCLPENFNRTP